MNKPLWRITSLILAFALIAGNFIDAQATAKANTMQTTGGMWISAGELMSLPTSGSAWDKLRAAAYGSWGTVNLADQETKHAINTLAGALVYARTGDASLRTKVRDAIIAAKRTLDTSSEWQTSNGVLAAGRQIGAYVIAADLIGLRNFDAAADSEFRNWLGPIRTTNIGTHGRWKAITFTCENAAANWGTFACASRIAASIYLGDTADVQRSASIIRAFFGERNAYPADAPGRSGYFQHTAGYDLSWSCADSIWQAINPPCIKLGVNINGALLDDASRGGGCCTLKGDGIMYSWEALQGLFVSAELLYRTGAHGNPYSWSNQALKRSMDFMQRSGWGISNVAKYVPWMANARYGTSYPTAVTISGRIMSWGAWLYQGTTTPPVSQPTATSTPTAIQPTITPQPTSIPPTATPITISPTVTSLLPTITSLPPTVTLLPPTVGAQTTYDDKDSVFVYSGTWENITASGSYEDTFKRCSTPGQSVSMTFTGTSFSLIYAKNSTFSTMQVFVDDVLVGTIDQYAPYRRLQEVWNLPNTLASGTHTLKLVHAGADTTQRITLDAVTVYP